MLKLLNCLFTTATAASGLTSSLTLAVVATEATAIFIFVGRETDCRLLWWKGKLSVSSQGQWHSGPTVCWTITSGKPCIYLSVPIRLPGWGDKECVACWTERKYLSFSWDPISAPVQFIWMFLRRSMRARLLSLKAILPLVNPSGEGSDELIVSWITVSWIVVWLCLCAFMDARVYWEMLL